MKPSLQIVLSYNRFLLISLLLVIAAAFALGTALAIKAWPTADSGAKPKGIVTTGLASPAAVASVPIVDPVQALLDTLPKASDNSSASEKALQEAASQVKKRPQDAVCLVDLGDAIAQRVRETSDPGLYSLALLSYQQALARSPFLPDAMTGIAWVYGGQHAFPQSVEWANRALKVDPGNPAAQGLLGDAALELGDYEGALVSYQKMMDARPDLSSWSRGAYLLWINGDRNRAKMLMEKAIRAGGPFAENTSWCRARLAMMAFHEGAYLPAAQALDVPLRASTTNTHVLLAAARIACALQDLQTGAEYFERVLKNGPHIEALAGLGDIAQAKGDATGAEGFYQKVLDLHAYNVTHGVHDHMAMAKFYADHDRNPVEAVRLAEQHKDSKNVLEADVLAWVYFKAGDQERAIAAIKIALSRGTPDAEIEYHAGMIAAEAGDKASAGRHLRKALGLNPQFSVLQAPIAERAVAELAAGGGS